MKRTLSAVAVLSAAASFACNVQASPIQLNEAFDYNAYILGDMTGNQSDVEGRLAVGGSLTLNHYDIGLLLEPDLQSSVLYSGGSMTLSNSLINNGQTTSGGSLSASQSEFSGGVNAAGSVAITEAKVAQGDIHADGDVDLYRAEVTNGNVISGGNVSLTEAGVKNGDVSASGSVSPAVNVENGTVSQYASVTPDIAPLDFDAINREVFALSSYLGGLSANGTTTVRCHGGISCSEVGASAYDITFTGSDSLNIFNVDADWLSDPGKSVTFDFSTTSYNIINVYGDTVSLFETGFYSTVLGGKIEDNWNSIRNEEYTRHDGTYTNNVLFNFVDTTDLTLAGIGFKGSILAPFADTNFYNGHIDGNLIVGSLSSPDGEYTGQVNDYRFGDIKVSEPASVLLFGVVGAILFSRRRTLRLQRKA
ncbi:choice-of-anchor A family protein [Alteromonas sp. CYL-A6]|uniref:choice-of-anchor A family protein n=1 Tax=Alteromonas nitratireducens TaxID=3390813 RepID=UPI0034B96DDB